jgi:two-component system chemotaxis response regulator CheB
MINLSLTDLIQMVCLSRSDIVIRVRSGATDGVICIKKGQVLHAETNTLQGERAFLEILRWKDGMFEIQSSGNLTSSSIDKPWEHLLLEAMREHDERLDEGRSEPSADGVEIAVPQSIPLLGAENVATRVDIAGDHWEEHNQSAGPGHGDAQPGTTSPRIIRVLVVDDSTFFTRQLKRLIEADQDIEVVGIAANGREAVDFLSRNPSVDVITLDIQMPVMQGDTTLKHIMIRHAVPVVIMSALNPGQINKVMDFLQLGAVDFVAKPAAHEEATEYGGRLRALIRGAALAEVNCFKRFRRSDLHAGPDHQTGLEQGERALLLVGAEGAHMEWPRLPLRQLCSRGIVLGVQRISASLLPAFAECLGELSGTVTVPVGDGSSLRPGALHLGNAGIDADFTLRSEPFRLDIEARSSGSLSWSTGLSSWMERLSTALGSRLSVCILSGSEPISHDALNGLMINGSRLIIPSTPTIVCKRMIQGVERYARENSIVFTGASYENLKEVWAENASHE